MLNAAEDQISPPTAPLVLFVGWLCLLSHLYNLHKELIDTLHGGGVDVSFVLAFLSTQRSYWE